MSRKKVLLYRLYLCYIRAALNAKPERITLRMIRSDYRIRPSNAKENLS